MKVIRAEVLGFCFGVKRAVAAAEEALASENKSAALKDIVSPSTEKTPAASIYTLGPLIHNPVVLDELKQKGLHVLEEKDVPNVKKNDTVIVRAHGTTPEIIEQLKSSGANVLDETCPRVHASQTLAAKWAKEGYTIIIAGDKNHGEVTGITGYATYVTPEQTGANQVNAKQYAPVQHEQVFVVQNKDEAALLAVPEKAVLLAQTTFSPESFEEITELLRQKNKDLQVFNTICTATMERQNALKKLAGVADGIIVIGGKNSANTRRLFETAQTICQNDSCGKTPCVVLIENASQIPQQFFTMQTVALTAGASTPDRVIDEVEQKLTGQRKND